MNLSTRKTQLNFNNVMNLLKKDLVLVIASVLAIISCFFNTPKLEYIDFKVLALLFNLMIIVAAFKDFNLFDYIATKILSKCTSYKSLSFTLVAITFCSAMIITNDVALLTFVPLTLIICKKADLKSMKIIILQTLAANLGSSLTPMGNPQNLYIYSTFNISPFEFFKISLPLAVLSIIFLLIILFKDKNFELSVELNHREAPNKKKIALYSTVFILILLSVFHLIDYRIIFILTMITVLFNDPKLFKKVDYSLIITFIAFFVFIGNISALDSVKNFMTGILATKESTYFASITASQFISNVPATILISPFIEYYKELLLGVNVGGLGTLIASLASVISYKLYISEYPDDNKEFIKSFTFYNILGLIILIPLMYLLIK